MNKYLNILAEKKINSSLPFAFFNSSHQLEWANKRMLDLLGFDNQNIKFPLKDDDVETHWPFFNEEKSVIAIFNQLRTYIDHKGNDDLGLIPVEAFLKTFHLELHYIQNNEFSGAIVIAKMLRTGDLLKDSKARETLLRSLSHEIRTSVTSLKGYIDMLEDSANLEQKIMIKGLERATKRLDHVVNRLGDLKAEFNKAS